MPRQSSESPELDTSAQAKRGRSVLVWDIGVRAFHWLLVIAVAIAAQTGFFGTKQGLDYHLIAGASIAALVVFRLVWGGLGGTYARFSSFLAGPSTITGHIRDLFSGRAPAHVGHNPVGGLMIAMLLLLLASLAVTGVVVLGGRIKDGPLAHFVSFKSGVLVREVHEALAFGLVALVALHVLGVLAESWRTRENLVVAMLTGRKRESVGAHASPGRKARPVLAACVSAAVLGAAILATVHFSSLHALGVPSGALDQRYASECGACHAPHHPSLALAEYWSRIMVGLDDHFGDNASLDPAIASQLLAYLKSNAAERWDSAPANLLRRGPVSPSLRITETRGWKRAHRNVPEPTFTSKAVGGKVNCVRCHRDGESGHFLPRAIQIPRPKS